MSYGMICASVVLTAIGVLVLIGTVLAIIHLSKEVIRALKE